jgi:hypothetical protein
MWDVSSRETVESPVEKTVLRRNIGRMNNAAFRETLASKNWESLWNMNVSKAAATLDKFVIEALDCHAPVNNHLLLTPARH